MTAADRSLLPRCRASLVPLGALLFGATLGGCCAFSAAPYRGRPSIHYHHGAFQNEHPRDHGGFWRLLRWQLSRRRGPWRERVAAKPGPPPPRRVEGKGLRVTFIGHATLLLQLDGLNVLTDPVYSARIGPVSGVGPTRVRPPGVRFADLPRIDVVIISHNHYDHMDLPTLLRLQRAFQPRFFVGLGNAAYLHERGLRRVVELDWWEQRELAPGFALHSVPAQHFSSRGLCDFDQTLWTGYVLDSHRAGRVYFAGDTGFGPHFRAIGKRFGPLRLALLPIGAFRPRWFMSAVHIDPAQAVRAHILLAAQQSIGMHFGTFRLADDGEHEPLRELARALARQKPSAPFTVLSFGQGRTVR